MGELTAQLTAQQIVTALGEVPGLATDQLVFMSPIQRDGAGWRVRLELPWGIYGGAVIRHREAISQKLGHNVAVGSADGTGHITLWIADGAAA